MGDRERLNSIAQKLKGDRDELKGKKGKQDKLAKAVKALTKAEFDALPKALQKELKEFLNWHTNFPA